AGGKAAQEAQIKSVRPQFINEQPNPAGRRDDVHLVPEFEQVAHRAPRVRRPRGAADPDDKAFAHACSKEGRGIIGPPPPRVRAGSSGLSRPVNDCSCAPSPSPASSRSSPTTGPPGSSPSSTGSR